jgi:hypothetical protein
MTTELLNKDGSPMREHESPIVKQLLEESEAEKKPRESGLNPLELKTGSAYLEYILNSEHELLWMHFDEAQRIESEGKDEAFEDGFQTGYNTAMNQIMQSIERAKLNFQENEQ